MVVGGVLVSLDGLGGFWTVIEALVDGLVAVEEVVAAFLRVWLFAVFVVGTLVYIMDMIVSMRFNQYLRDLDQDNRFDALFFDKTHILTKNANWRHKFISIKLLSFAV